MATIKGPKGRMTKALVTAYEVGDRVILTQLHGEEDSSLIGSAGVIRRIEISCPSDGDDTFLMFDVTLDSGPKVYVGAGEIAPEAEVKAAIRMVQGFRVLNGGRLLATVKA
jgi:hypothetical protein